MAIPNTLWRCDRPLEELLSFQVLAQRGGLIT
jgi:hypothetical protein